MVEVAGNHKISLGMADRESQGRSKSVSPGVGRWVRLIDAADALSLSPAKILKRVKSGKLQGSRVGEHWFVHLQAPNLETQGLNGPAGEDLLSGEQVDRLRGEFDALKEQIDDLKRNAERQSHEEAQTTARSLNTLVRTVTEESDTIRSEVDFLRTELREIRVQHSEEMRRKDVLLQKTQDMLLQLLSEKPQEVAYEGAGVAALSHDLDAIRGDQKSLAQVLAEMTSFMAVISRRVKQPA